MNSRPITLSYQRGGAPSGTRIRSVAALAFSIVAALPAGGVFVWSRITHQGGDWGAGLAAIPFLVASTILSPLSLIAAVAAIGRSKMATRPALTAVIISFATTAWCLWIWVH
jgi:hypothetical protein